MPAKQTKNPPPSSLQPKPFNGGLKWKMVTLIGMLIMVIYCMNEAGKPENWAWMGFDKSSNSNDKPSDAPNSDARLKADNEPANSTASSPSTANSDDAPATSTAATNEATAPKSNRSAANPTEAIRITKLSPNLEQNNQPTDLPAESARFWSSFFERLTTAEQVQWMDMLEVLISKQPPAQRPAATETQTELIASAQQQRDDFNNSLLDRMASIPHASEKRTKVSADYFESNKFWKNQIAPALMAFLNPNELTLNQHQAVVDVQHHLDIEALNLVQDRTSVGWTGDSVAWRRSWSRIYQSNIGEPTYVKRIQLTGQPREFRGKAIKVYGFVRDIETRRAASSDSIAGPQKNDASEIIYYVLWVEPSDSDAGPYCIYCLNLPPELPLSKEKLTDFKQLAIFDGIFFKNRSYQRGDRSVHYCPMILTNGLELKPTFNWKLSPTWMATLLALVPIVGVGIVWYAVRSTVGRKRLPSKKSQEEIDVFLGDLKNDPSIKTESEQIQAIAEHEDDIL